MKAVHFSLLHIMAALLLAEVIAISLAICMLIGLAIALFSWSLMTPDQRKRAASVMNKLI